MLKTAFIASVVLIGAAPTSVQFSEITTPAEQTILNLPPAETVIAQLSYLEISHGPDGFGLSATVKTAVFVDFEFSGDLHIRIGF